MKTISLILISGMLLLTMKASSFTSLLKPVPGYNSVAEIFRTIDPKILPKNAVDPTEGNFTSNPAYVEVLNQKAAEIRNYIAVKYREDLSNLTNIEVITLGLIIVPFESREMSPGYMNNEQIFDCMMVAIGAATGINALISMWNSGATVGTILGTLKSILRVSYGWFAVGYAVYKFGSCVHWW
jgi:hypothetical protein